MARFLIYSFILMIVMKSEYGLIYYLFILIISLIMTSKYIYDLLFIYLLILTIIMTSEYGMIYST